MRKCIMVKVGVEASKTIKNENKCYLFFKWKWGEYATCIIGLGGGTPLYVWSVRGSLHGCISCHLYDHVYYSKCMVTFSCGVLWQFQNLLAGALFGVTYGFPLTCLLSAVGATCCYALSKFFGKQYILHHFSGKITPLSIKVSNTIQYNCNLIQPSLQSSELRTEAGKSFNP